MPASDLAMQLADQALPDGLEAWFEKHQQESIRKKAKLLSDRLGVTVSPTTVQRWETRCGN